MKDYIPHLIIMLLSVVLGFFAGRASTDRIEDTIAISGEPVSGSVTGMQPVSETKPLNPELPMRRDTVYIDSIIYVRETVDTAAIIAEYELSRQYLVPLFDNQYGKLELSVSTQYNRLHDVSYTFLPIHTIQRVQIKKTWQPYVSSSYSTIGLIGVGGGLFYNSIGLEYQRQYSVQNNQSSGHMIGLKYKF